MSDGFGIGSKSTQTLIDERRVRFDSADGKNSYANICHVTSTKSEIVLNFGLDRSRGKGQQDI